MGIPIDGVEGWYAPAVSVAEVGDDDGLACCVKQGFADLAGDARGACLEVHIAKGVLKNEGFEFTNFKLAAGEAVADNVELCCPGELEDIWLLFVLVAFDMVEVEDER